MSTSSGFQLLISTFQDETSALKAVDQLLEQFKSAPHSMPAVASVVRSADGSVAIKESSDLGGKQGAAAGAIAGGLVGLLSRRSSVVGTAALGALLGGVAAKAADTGIPDPRLQAIGDALDHATSAAVAIVSDEAMSSVRVIVDGLGATSVAEEFDHKTDFFKHIQEGDYSGALTALANQTEGTVSGASDTATSMAQQMLNRNKPA